MALLGAVGTTLAILVAQRIDTALFGQPHSFQPPPEGATLSARAIAGRRTLAREPVSNFVTSAAAAFAYEGWRLDAIASGAMAGLLGLFAVFTVVARAVAAADLRQGGVEP